MKQLGCESQQCNTLYDGIISILTRHYSNEGSDPIIACMSLSFDIVSETYSHLKVKPDIVAA